MIKTTERLVKETALSKALENEKGAERPTVYKGFYIYADQYATLLQLSAHNKIKGIYPSTSSDIIRIALDEYFAENQPDDRPR